jgi:hypothetical protein
MMIDLILAASMVACYVGGFWCGGKYGTLKSMINTLLKD